MDGSRRVSKLQKKSVGRASTKNKIPNNLRHCTGGQEVLLPWVYLSNKSKFLALSTLLNVEVDSALKYESCIEHFNCFQISSNIQIQFQFKQSKQKVPI